MVQVIFCCMKIVLVISEEDLFTFVFFVFLYMYKCMIIIIFLLPILFVQMSVC